MDCFEGPKMKDSQPGHWNRSFERIFAVLFVLVGLFIFASGVPLVIALSLPLVLLAVIALALVPVGWGCYVLYRSFVDR